MVTEKEKALKTFEHVRREILINATPIMSLTVLHWQVFNKRKYNLFWGLLTSGFSYLDAFNTAK